jgi:cysteine synthase A
MIDLTRNEEVRARNIERCRERGITLPTFEQMRDPSRVPREVRDRLRTIGLWGR